MNKSNPTTIQSRPAPPGPMSNGSMSPRSFAGSNFATTLTKMYVVKTFSASVYHSLADLYNQTVQYNNTLVELISPAIRAHSITKELNHPRVGMLVLQPTALALTDDPNLKLFLYIPLAQADTAKKLSSRADTGSRTTWTT